MVPGEPLGNGALYQLATTRSMEGNHFASPPRPRRRQGREGLDDQQHQAEGAQAVLTQEKVLITLPQYRAYHEQYDKRSAKLKELGTLSRLSSEDYRLGSARAIMINFLHFIEFYENAQ